MKIWKLNNNYLINCDLSDFEEVAFSLRKIGINGADTIIADPPYGMGKKIINDSLKMDELMDFYKKWFGVADTFLRQAGCFFSFGNDLSTLMFYADILRYAEGYTVKNVLSWNKTFVPGSRSPALTKFPDIDEKIIYMLKQVKPEYAHMNAVDYDARFDPVRLYMQGEFMELRKAGLNQKEIARRVGVTSRALGHWKDKSQFELIPENRYLDLQQLFSGRFLKPYKELAREYLSCKYGEHANILNTLEYIPPNKRATQVAVAGKEKTNVSFDLSREQDSVTSIITVPSLQKENRFGHECPKPIELYSKLINISTKPGETVFELFAGTAPGLMASEKIGRRCISFELSEQWCQTILERFRSEFKTKIEVV